MNTTMKKLLGLLTVTAVLCLAPLAATAQNLADLQIRDLNRIRSAVRTVGADTSDFVRLTYVGTSTEAVVTITTTVITAYAPAGVADSSNFGVSAGSYTLFSAAYDTMGELCDVIDALANYECELLGAKRDDNTKKMKDQTATSGTCDLKSAGGCVIEIHSGAAAVANADAYDMRVGITPPTGGRVHLRTCTTNVSGADSIKVYGKLRRFEGASDGVTRNDTTEVWSTAVADDTDKTIPTSLVDNGFLEFAKDAHVVVSAGNGTTVQVAANSLECLFDLR